MKSTEEQRCDRDAKLQGFDSYMEKLLKDWNAPGVGVGIVVDDKLVLAKGYGYRDYEKKLPITAETHFPIASNTKLFTAVAAGMLVEEGKLTWDKPIRDAVPAIQFHTQELNNTVTLRDMLAHRTGITRHDMIWYESDFTQKEIFDRVKYLKPTAPLRQTFIYNNLMYAAVGHIFELQTGMTWEEFVRDKILSPLDMPSSVFTIEDMLKKADYAVPFSEKRETTELHQIPYYDKQDGVAPAGAIISNLKELSHWLIALMNDGQYEGKQILPPSALQATLTPSIAMPNVFGETRGWWENLNAAYGMGRWQSSYRGYQFTFHGGNINGFHSQVSYLPHEKMGAIVFVIGDHCAGMRDVITYNICERLLGLCETPWSERILDMTVKAKQAGKEARSKAGAECMANTKPSHALSDYVGEYEDPAYGILRIGLTNGQLEFNFRKLKFPMSHFHYDRFDTGDDERYGKWSTNFLTNPQGEIDKVTMSLDQSEVTFVRKPAMLEPQILKQLVGTYETATGFKFQIVLREDGFLYRAFPGQPEEKLLPNRGLAFRVLHFADMTNEFVMENGQVKALKQRSPSGEYVHLRCCN